MEYIIYQVDAFTNKPFGGNPAAVVPNAIGLDDEWMQKIAGEMNLSETAFVFPIDPRNNYYEVRFFTPTQEVDLCGHATIATFYALIEKGYIKKSSQVIRVKQKTKAGILDIHAKLTKGQIKEVMMQQAKPQIIDVPIEKEEICEIMGIKIEDYGVEGYDVEAQVISTGLKDIILPVRSLKALQSMNVNMDYLKEYSKNKNVTGVHAFTMETLHEKSTAHCRNFAPYVGIDEEAATGTSSGALGVYLIENKIYPIQNKIDFVFEQGYSLDRPSTIFCSIAKKHNRYDVYVGGQAIVCLEGVLKF